MTSKHRQLELIEADGAAHVGNFRICRKLDDGGFGSVYEAANIHNENIRVAIKILRECHATRADVRHRFFTEATAAAASAHPNIVQVFDVGTTESGLPYLVMELLKGRTLRRVLEASAGRRLSPARVLRVGVQIAAGLQAAHDRGILHRDLKPSNIFVVDSAADDDFVKVFDFGVARVRRDGRKNDESTQVGTIVGTFEYMSFEQLQGIDDIDARADIHALGVVLYRSLTGHLPRTARNFEQWLHAHLRVVQPQITDPEVPAPLVRLVSRMLSSRRVDRPASMSEVLSELRALMVNSDVLVEEMSSAHDTLPEVPSVPAPSEAAPPAPSEQAPPVPESSTAERTAPEVPRALKQAAAAQAPPVVELTAEVSQPPPDPADVVELPAESVEMIVEAPQPITGQTEPACDGTGPIVGQAVRHSESSVDENVVLTPRRRLVPAALAAAGALLFLGGTGFYGWHRAHSDGATDAGVRAPAAAPITREPLAAAAHPTRPGAAPAPASDVALQQTPPSVAPEATEATASTSAFGDAAPSAGSPARRPTNAVRRKAAAAHELLVQAAQRAYVRNEYPLALSRALRADPDWSDERTVRIIGLSSCRLGRRDTAQRAWLALRGPIRDYLAAQCARLGIKLP